MMPRHDSSNKLPSRSPRSWPQFCTCVLIVAVIWLLILPAISSRPKLQREIADRKAKQIDASAMFYTDLDLMDDVLARLDRFYRTHPKALWHPVAEQNPHSGR